MTDDPHPPPHRIVESLRAEVAALKAERDEARRRLSKIENAPFLYFAKHDMVNRSTDLWIRLTDEFMEDERRIPEPILAELVTTEIRNAYERMIAYGTAKVPPADREEALSEAEEADEGNRHFRRTDGE